MEENLEDIYHSSRQFRLVSFLNCLSSSSSRHNAQSIRSISPLALIL